MSTERNDSIHNYWGQSSEKFDYFITGATGALCAYLFQTFQPAKIYFSPDTLELLSLLILIATVFAGFKRIENIVETYRHNHISLYLSEYIGQLVSNYDGRPLINEATGETMSPEQVEAKIEALKHIYTEVRNDADSRANAAGKWYKCRNRLLATSLLLLVASKIWVAYA